MNKKTISKFALATLLSLTVSGCSNSSSDEFIAKAVDRGEIFDMFDTMYRTKTFHQKIYGDNDTFDFIYHNDEYISQSGGGINYSLITLPSYKAGEDGDRVYMAKYTEGKKGHKNYVLSEAIYNVSYTTGEITGPTTSIAEYNPIARYEEYRINRTEISLDKSKENTFVMRYNNVWHDYPAYDSFYFLVSSMIQGDPMLGAGRLKKIEMSVSTKGVLRVIGYITQMDENGQLTNVVAPYYQSDFYDIGTASDTDLEKFLKSDNVKISNVAPTRENFSNIFESHISTDTDIYQVVNGVKSYVGSNHLDFDDEHAHIYGIDGNFHYSNISGNLFKDFIDGGNEIFHENQLLPYSVINGLKDNVDVDDFRQVATNKYRYYGINFAEVFGDLSETSTPAGWAFSNLYVELNNGLVSKYVLETSTERAVMEDGGEADVYFILETKVVTPRTVEILIPYERNEEDCARLEKALAVLNDMEVEFKVHGEEHSEDPDTDNPSVRDVYYALDYVYEEHKYSKPHMDANANTTVEEHFDREGYYLNSNEEGTPIGVTEFKYNYKGELVAKKAMNTKKTSLYDYWYYAEPAAEIFDYDTATRTYTSKPYTGYFAAILIKKAFETAADNFMDEVRITLNETLDRVETIEYDAVWIFSDGWSTKMTGRLDFTYDIDTEPLRQALKAMAPYQVPQKWSDSANGYEISREFNDYMVGAKDCHGNDFDVDMVPYLYDEQGDLGWVALQFSIASELWMIQDNGFKNKNYINDLIALFEADPDYTKISPIHNLSGVSEVSFKNGDLIVSMFPDTNEGPWFTNLAR